MVNLDFVCKRVPIAQILRCSFSINRTEIDIMMLLIRENKEMETVEIMKKVGKDKTTVQRAMKSLSEKELVHRKQINLERGGYVFVYYPVSKKYIKERIYKNLELFKENIGKEIERW